MIRSGGLARHSATLMKDFGAVEETGRRKRREGKKKIAYSIIPKAQLDL